jgi:hypothetical protein
VAGIIGSDVTHVNRGVMVGGRTVNVSTPSLHSNLPEKNNLNAGRPYREGLPGADFDGKRTPVLAENGSRSHRGDSSAVSLQSTISYARQKPHLRESLCIGPLRNHSYAGWQARHNRDAVKPNLTSMRV